MRRQMPCRKSDRRKPTPTSLDLPKRTDLKERSRNAGMRPNQSPKIPSSQGWLNDFHPAGSCRRRRKGPETDKTPSDRFFSAEYPILVHRNEEPRRPPQRGSRRSHLYRPAKRKRQESQRPSASACARAEPAIAKPLPIFDKIRPTPMATMHRVASSAWKGIARPCRIADPARHVTPSTYPP